MKKKIFIEGMSCGHCSGRVEKALKEQEEINDVVVDLEGKNAVIELNQDLADEKITEIIDDIGYDVVKIEKL
ncbi:MAG: heavy-metal-associated domain-containing protein [Clostridiales bacterium]|nr:heavy-metal-associated domain-containing protein [Clostridiales bacterium]